LLLLAERLGMTKAELCGRMSHAELIEWVAHDELTAFEREHAAKAAEMEAKAR
jgi:hypothetical protein